VASLKYVVSFKEEYPTYPAPILKKYPAYPALIIFIPLDDFPQWSIFFNIYPI